MQTSRYARRSCSGYFMAPRNRFASRPRFRARKFFGKKNGRAEAIDPSRFINKAVTVQEKEEAIPESNFQDFNIGKEMKSRIASRGYKTATPIQAQAIPLVLKGADVVGIADTGTGKTAAFLVPLINKVLGDRKSKVLAVAPTRELADQINKEFKQFSHGLRLFSACCVGGTSIARQIKELKFNNSFIIGTPGRLKDLIERGRIDPAKFNTIVLDEADRMLDMGFINDMRYLVDKMPHNRQTLLFSATMSPKIKSLIGEFTKQPSMIAVKTRDTSQNVEQDVVRIGNGNKTEALENLLRQKEFAKVLVFGRTKHGVENLYKSLVKKGFKAGSIHGNKNYSKRQKALEMFKTNAIQVLVATDVAARGLDVADITHVINYDLPETYEDYIHRIGRTGRGSNFGKALTFIS